MWQTSTKWRLNSHATACFSPVNPFVVAVILVAFFLPAVTAASPQTTTAYDNFPVASSADQTHPLAVGAKIPPGIVLTAIDGKPFNLDRAIHSKPTILIFYRGSWCPFCNIQMGQLEPLQPQLIALGYQTLAISPDLPKNLQTSVAKHQLTYTLLSDSDMVAAKAFGLAFTVDAPTIARMATHGVDLEEASGRTHHELPVPAAYVVDRAGVIRFAYTNPDFHVRVDPDALLAAAKANATSHAAVTMP